MVPVHECLDHHDMVRPRRGLDRVHLLDGERQRLLAQHVLARGRGLDRPFRVQVIRERDVDRVDLPVVEQRLVRSVGALDPPLARVRRRARPVAARDRQQPVILGSAERRDHRPVDARGPEQPPAKGAIAHARHSITHGSHY